jgi:murein DD-endopeptidase MepM/ murein hydrolase activator NlpD
VTPLLRLAVVLGALLAQPVSVRASECPEGVARLPVKAAIDRPFGFRLHPVIGMAVFQSSAVFRTRRGQIVRTVWGGRVMPRETKPRVGRFVWIRQHDGSELRYGPLSHPRVRAGQCVAAGATLGRTTSSPFALAIWRDGVWIDPAPVFGTRR